jgi:hypothetical protein
VSCPVAELRRALRRYEITAAIAEELRQPSIAVDELNRALLPAVRALVRPDPLIDACEAATRPGPRT